MNTCHRWFRSGGYTLLRHIDAPQIGGSRLGVVIVPPFGWEHVCSYRPLRFLGKALAENGIPCLRFDLPGNGDSSGSALDSRLVEAWIQSIADAAAELRTWSGVQEVAAAGIGLGAMLAATAAARGADLQDLILWGAASTGRALVRELRIFGKMETSEFATGEPSAWQPIPGLAIAGFLISPETQKDLEALDLLTLQRMQGRRMMILSRDDNPPDARFVRALEAAGGAVEIRAGRGYTAMMAAPDDALPPPAETATAIVEFLKKRGRNEAGEKARNASATRVLTESAADRTAEIENARVLETIHTFGRLSASNFGILSEPAAEASRTDLCLLFLNPGSVRHIGSNRIWVEAARRWAARGVPSLRMDFVGVGESDGAPCRGIAGLYQDELLEDIEAAMASLRSRAGARRFAVIGLCSGAFWAFHAAIRNPDIRGAILLNPRLFFWDPEVDRRRILRRTVTGLTDSNTWRRLVSGKITAQRIGQGAQSLVKRSRTLSDIDRRPQIPPDAMARSLAALENNRSRVTFVFTEGEPLLLEMEEEGHLPPENSCRIRCIRIANCGHTFRPLWAQHWVHELIDREFEAVLRESSPVLKEYAAKIPGSS